MQRGLVSAIVLGSASLCGGCVSTGWGDDPNAGIPYHCRQQASEAAAGVLPDKADGEARQRHRDAYVSRDCQRYYDRSVDVELFPRRSPGSGR